MSIDKLTKRAVGGFIIWFALIMFIMNVDYFPTYDYNVLTGIVMTLLFLMIYSLIIFDD